MSVVKEITCITGKYTAPDGTEKNRYQRIGSVISTAKGEMIKIDCIPVGDWNGWAYMNDPKPKDGYQQAAAAHAPQQVASTVNYDEEDLPF